MKKTDKNAMIAACGLNCSTCGIHLAESNRETAERLAKDFSSKGIIADAKPEMFRCDGCRGDRSRHWSPDCWILKCAVDDKGLEYCSHCSDFPCSKLEEWSNEREGYKKALNYLKSM